VSYYGYRSLELESEALRVVVTPEVGGKIVSLRDRRSGREWLVTPEQSGGVPPNPFRAWTYGTEYNPNQSGGWDEMMPTILACSYPGTGPYYGRDLPDHGEAWTAPWSELGSTGNEISLEMAGQALPYRLRRTMSLSGDTLVMSYTLRNDGEAPITYLWAAHPQFTCDPGATIVLPDDVSEVVNVLPLEWGPEFGPPGACNPWPAFAVHGQEIRQDRVVGPGKHGGRKFYLPPGLPISWGELRQPSGEWLRLSWDSEFAPYCGVWIDEGYLNKVSDVAFEPATGYYDNLAAAWPSCPTLQPQAAVSWTLQVQLGQN
jgi:galactose mutarotase-like enzyme